MTKHILHIYCRVSTDAQTEHGYSLEAQKKAGIARANSLGFDPKLYTEAGKSAAYDTIDNRPILKDMVNQCDDGVIKHIFITELDRLSRSPVAMDYLKKIFKENEIIVHTTSQSLNFNDDDQEFMSDVTALLSQRENKLRVKRSKRGMFEAAQKGRWSGPMHPYGYNKDSNGILQIDPEEANVVKEIFEMSLNGIGSNTIAKKMNTQGYPTRAKKVLQNGTKVRNKFTNKIRQVSNSEFVWRAGTIFCMLKNPIYKGERRYKGHIFSFPAIIEKELWEDVQLNLKRNKNYSSNHKKKHFYLLKGLITCRKCENNFYGRWKADEKTYMCSSKRTFNCGTRSINLNLLNNIVFKLVTDNKLQMEMFKKEFSNSNSELRKPLLESDIKKISANINLLDNRRSQLIILFEKAKISIDEFEERSQALKIEKDELTQILGSKQSELLLINSQINTMKDFNAADVEEKLNDWSDIEKQQFVNKKIKRIIISWLPLKNMHVKDNFIRKRSICKECIC
eukprot:gene4024-5757_t